MGQAKQRKKIMGETYGKVANPWLKKTERAKAWLDEMYECLPFGYKPDLGHIVFFQTGYDPLVIAFPGHFLILPDREGAMLEPLLYDFFCSIVLKRKSEAFKAIQHLVKPNQILKVCDNNIILCIAIKVMPNDRYLTDDRQWVIPFEAESLVFLTPEKLENVLEDLEERDILLTLRVQHPDRAPFPQSTGSNPVRGHFVPEKFKHHDR